MADQREHGVGGLEWRDTPARTPDEPLVPSSGARARPADEAVTPDAGDRVGQHSGTGERAGDPDGVARADDGFDRGPDGPTRRLLPVPPPVPETVEQEDPLDLSALRADDELLTELAVFGRSTTGSRADAELGALLQSWRLDVDAEPIRELVDTDTAMAAIAVGARINRRRPRLLVPLATAAAVLVVVFGGMGLAARNAQPGDALWGLTQVLYSDHARSVEAAAAVRSDLSHASEAIQQGQFGAARTALGQAQASLPAVDSSDGKANLQAQQQTLLSQLGGDGVPTQTSAPVYGIAPVSSTSTTAPPTTTTTAPVTTTTPPPPTTTSTPPPTTTTPPPTTTGTASTQSDTLQGSPAQPGDATGQPAAPANANQPVGAANAPAVAGN